jgi:aminocarboxymuconate-semialdehyde decarboxylase
VSVVDVHAHYLSPRLLERVRADEAALGVGIAPDAEGRDVLTVGGEPTNQAIPMALTAVEERFAWMDENDVDVQVVSSWMQLHGYNLPVEQGRRLAELQNDALAEFVATQPDRLRAAGTLPLQDGPAAVAELERIASTHGFRSVQIGTHVNDRELDDPLLDPFWAAAEELGILVCIHPFDPPGLQRVRRRLLEMLVAFPGETTLAAASLLYGGVLERFPELKLVLPHGGGFLPYQLDRLQHGWEVLGDRVPAKVPPVESAKRLYFDSVMHGVDGLAFLVDRMGADRVILGSDYPFNLGELRPLENLRRLGLPQERLDAILGGTTLELLEPARAPIR